VCAVAVLDSNDQLDQLGTAELAWIKDFVVRPIDPQVLLARLRMLARRRDDTVRERALLDAMPDLMFRLTRDGVYLDYRARRQEDLFCAPELFLGRKVTDVLPFEVGDHCLAAIHRTLERQASTNFEYSLDLPDGLHTYEARIVPAGANEVLSIVRDVTDLHAAEHSLRLHVSERQALTQRLLTVQEDERRALSRELHDGIGQRLSVHYLDAERLAKKSGDLEDDAAAMRDGIRETLEAVRGLARGLRPPGLEHLGLGTVVRSLAREITQRTGIDCSCSIYGDLTDLDSQTAVNLYRIAQEALTNAVRHSQCKAIEVSLHADEKGVDLRITDDGRGIDSKSSPRLSLGLLGMHERTELLRGELSISHHDERGTVVTAHVPRQ
jgi:signal transduction histidine kinase